MNISILGIGYVGLVTGLCFAEKGHKVLAYDIDKKKINQIQNKQLTIYEPNLKKLLNKNINKSFYCTNNLKNTILNSDITFVCVPTPYSKKIFNLKFIKAASIDIAKVLNIKNSKHLIVYKSTILPTTCEQIILPLLKKKLKKSIFNKINLAFNPEFLREGDAVNDFMHPDRLVIGSKNKETCDLLKKVYKPFNFEHVITTNIKTAEMIKYASNAFFANLISFSNEIANLSFNIKGIDSFEVINGLKLDKRFYNKVNNKNYFPSLISYIEPGPGFGGSCFPKDVKSLIEFGKKNGRKMELLSSVLKVNESQHKEIVRILKTKFKNLKNINISILGLSFKADTDDIRESPSLKLIKKSGKLFKSIKVFDPIVKLDKEFINNKNIFNVKNLEEATKNVKVIIIMNKWKIFNKLKILIKKNNNTYIFDTRRMFDKKNFKNYLTIGLSNEM